MTTTDRQKSKQELGSTDEDGLLKLPILAEPSTIRVNAKITPTEGIISVVSVKLNAVPPTGAAKITGGSTCGMTVHDNGGERITLPCTEENTLQWVDQVNALVANFSTKLLPPGVQAASADTTQLEPVEVTFEITARQNHAIYLPLVVTE